jgi:predicted acylesterase/phospholipase RssA
MLKDLKLGVLLKNLDKSNFSFNLDLVLEGGCMNGAYEIGGLILIKELEKLKYFKIKRVSGASVGAYAGLLYLIDKLHVYVEEYEIMKEGFRETLTLEKLEQQLRKLVYNLSDKEFKSLQKNKLYIRFYDVNTQECILKYKYKTREELIETILKSCHMPFLINGKMFYEKDKKQYIDGGMPYIFNDLEAIYI